MTVESSGSPRRELRVPVGTWLGQVVDQPVQVQLFEPFSGEGRSGTITQQPFQPAPIICLDAYLGVEGESAAVVQLLHLGTTAGIRTVPWEGGEKQAFLCLRILMY